MSNLSAACTAAQSQTAPREKVACKPRFSHRPCIPRLPCLELSHMTPSNNVRAGAHTRPAQTRIDLPHSPHTSTQPALLKPQPIQSTQPARHPHSCETACPASSHYCALPIIGPAQPCPSIGAQPAKPNSGPNDPPFLCTQLTHLPLCASPLNPLTNTHHQQSARTCHTRHPPLSSTRSKALAPLASS